MEYVRQLILRNVITTAQLALLWLIAALSLVPYGANAFLKPLLGLVYGILLVQLFAHRFFAYLRFGLSWLLGALVAIGFFALAGSALFYGYELNSLTLSLLTFLCPLLMYLKRDSHAQQSAPHIARPDSSLMVLAATSAYLLVVAALAVLFVQGIARESLVSPWLTLSPLVFIGFFSLCALTLVLLHQRRSSWLYYLALFAIAISVTTIVFPLGNGFDPFIHQATEKILIGTGTILPKPPYYTGFYALVAWLAHWGLPFDAVDRFILPVSIAAILPASVYLTSRYLLQEKKMALLMPFLLLVFPYPELVQSTPQGASFLWSLLTIVLSPLYLRTNLLPFWVMIVVATTSLVFHPLTGIPTLVFGLYCGIYKKMQDRNRRLLTIGFVITGIFLMPLLFILAPLFSSSLSVSFIIPAALTLGSVPTWFPFATLDDLLYLYAENYRLIFLLFAVAGLVWFVRHARGFWVPYVLGSVVAFANYFVVKNFYRFNFATASENEIFADRLLVLAFYFLIPLCFMGFYAVVRRLRSALYVQTSLLVALCLLATVPWYLSYPRFDTRSQSKGYSASRYDYEAVHWINTDARADAYVVLANQTVSAVAVKEFGFQRYYEGTFYYPLPTNGWLYQMYLDLTRKKDLAATLSTIKQKTGVGSVYFVLNNYWDKAAELEALWAPRAQKYQRIGEGKITIFKFRYD